MFQIVLQNSCFEKDHFFTLTITSKYQITFITFICTVHLLVHCWYVALNSIAHCNMYYVLGTVVDFPLPFIGEMQEVTLKGRSRMSKYVRSPLEVQGCPRGSSCFLSFFIFLVWIVPGDLSAKKSVA